ncbi:hypothetical protein [Nocardia sp. CA-120079]
MSVVEIANLCPGRPDYHFSPRGAGHRKVAERDQIFWLIASLELGVAQ